MNARWLRFVRRLFVVAVFSTAVFGLAACGSDEPIERAQEAQSEVVMRLIAYKPDRLEVATGTAVIWKQQDAGFHTVTSGTVSSDASGSTKTTPDGTFQSGQLATGDEFSFTFAEAGSYEYFCEVHPATMTGQVTAE